MDQAGNRGAVRGFAVGMEETTRRWIAAMRDERYADAWAIEQAILALRDPATRDDPAQPYHRRWVWDGRAPDGRDVLVRCYQGLGDTIQFARYLPLLAARARSVTVEAPARLHPLLRAIADVALLAFDPANPAPPADLDIEMTELASALRMPPLAVPVPYLAHTPAALPRGTIGLCWAAGDWDRDRWVPEALLAPVARAGPSLSLVAAPTALPVLNPDGCAFDLSATAALVAGCALVVTVDTMIAHLAGAMGKPVWLMLKAEPDWRWNPQARTSGWYPSARLYVQPRSGDWHAVTRAIARDLPGFFHHDVAESDHGQPAQSVGARLLG
ncbi:glycosyltransferase family 9 protein [Sphingomonas adhaesiva]|uniref:glycosyltransferase family 9 protein n=1 Tax=Sphingomonas adhaesiva TaxID=28212 RepID=UPI002FF5ECDB